MTKDLQKQIDLWKIEKNKLKEQISDLTSQMSLVNRKIKHLQRQQNKLEERGE